MFLCSSRGSCVTCVQKIGMSKRDRLQIKLPLRLASPAATDPPQVGVSCMLIMRKRAWRTFSTSVSTVTAHCRPPPWWRGSRRAPVKVFFGDKRATLQDSQSRFGLESVDTERLGDSHVEPVKVTAQQACPSPQLLSWSTSAALRRPEGIRLHNVQALPDEVRGLPEAPG